MAEEASKKEEKERVVGKVTKYYKILRSDFEPKRSSRLSKFHERGPIQRGVRGKGTSQVRETVIGTAPRHWFIRREDYFPFPKARAASP